MKVFLIPGTFLLSADLLFFFCFHIRNPGSPYQKPVRVNSIWCTCNQCHIIFSVFNKNITDIIWFYHFDLIYFICQHFIQHMKIKLIFFLKLVQIRQKTGIGKPRVS